MALRSVQLTAGVVDDRGSRGEDSSTGRASVLKPDRWRVIAAALVAGLFLAACGSSTTSSPSSGTSPTAPAAAASPTPTVTAAVCKAAADLRDSVTALTHVQIGAGTVNEISSGLADVQAKLTALTGELHDSFKAQTSAVQSALDTLKAAVSNLRAQPSASTVKGVTTAVGGVATAVSSLMSSLAPECGSASASPSA